MRALPRRLAVAAAVVWQAGTPAGAADRAQAAPGAPRLGACGTLTGGFLLPGTDACLRIGGFVRVEGAWALAEPALAMPPAGGRGLPSAASAGLDRSALGASARLSADLRLPTEAGPLRVFVSLRGQKGLASERAPR